jgi:hypothetical protein
MRHWVIPWSTMPSTTLSTIGAVDLQTHAGDSRRPLLKHSLCMQIRVIGRGAITASHGGRFVCSTRSYENTTSQQWVALAWCVDLMSGSALTRR